MIWDESAGGSELGERNNDYRYPSRRPTLIASPIRPSARSVRSAGVTTNMTV